MTTRPWALRRRLEYGIGFVFSLIVIIGGSYLMFRDTSYSCFDNMQNGEESGVDCGGACVRICAAEVIPPKILWATSFEITKGQYNAVAYVENLNEIAATPQLKYTFEFYDGDNLVTTRSGTTIFPPNSIYPIFEGRIFTDGRKITETKLILEPANLWQPATLGREQFKTSNIDLLNADDRPRLNATIENTALTGANKVEVVATLFNDAGIPLTSSQTEVEFIESRTKQDIVFTWPNPIAKTIKSCIIPTDVVLGIDLSGSMNNDGGMPPQPVTATLAAAKEFVERLSEKDQAAVVTFATDAKLDIPLSREHGVTANVIGSLSIKPESETGYTNTGAALHEAWVELSSSRHNNNARKVLVLLTDGLPTGKEDQEKVLASVQQSAVDLSTNGVIVYAIGLGQNLDRDFVTSLASDSEHAFFAPSGNDLSAIYSEITSSLCETGTAKIDIIAKTTTNFTPLR